MYNGGFCEVSSRPATPVGKSGQALRSVARSRGSSLILTRFGDARRRFQPLLVLVLLGCLVAGVLLPSPEILQDEQRRFKSFASLVHGVLSDADELDRKSVGLRPRLGTDSLQSWNSLGSSNFRISFLRVFSGCKDLDKVSFLCTWYL